MELKYLSDIITISDDELYEMDYLLESFLFPDSVWKSIDPYTDGELLGNDLRVLALELSEYELHLDKPYVQKVIQLREMAENAYNSGGSISIIGD